MGFLSKIFPKEKKKDAPNIKAIDYEMESLERELREYEQQRLAKGNAPRAQPMPQQQFPPPVQGPPQQFPPPVQGPPPEAARPLGQPRGIMVTETPSSPDASDEKVFDPGHRNKGGVFQAERSNVRVIDLETSARVMDTGSEKVVDQDFKEVLKEPAQEKPVSEISVILPVTPSYELEETEETTRPVEARVEETVPVAADPAEVQASTTPETPPEAGEGPMMELTPAPELAPVTEVGPQETPNATAEAEELVKPAVAVDAGTPKVQKKPKKIDGSPDELVAKLDDIITALEKRVETVGASGRDVTEAKKAIADAREHFDNKHYKTAKELAVKVKQMVV